jgi:hypothetical protein
VVDRDAGGWLPLSVAPRFLERSMPISILEAARRADEFFMAVSPIHQTMRRLTQTLGEMQIPFAIVGDFSGDGRPKPVVFPAPETVAETGSDGIPYVSLNTLLELKLASGMTAAHRPQDLADVIELIRVNHLPLEHADVLNPYVADTYRELWRAAQTVDDY